MSDAKAHIRLLEDKDGLRPDEALIQPRMVLPEHALPESSPGSLTGLVDFHARRAERP